MSQSVPMQELPERFFDYDNAVEGMGEALNKLLTNQLPAFMIRQAGDNIDQVTQEALGAYGWQLVEQEESFDKSVTAWSSLYRIISLSKRHVEGGGYSHYPHENLQGVIVRAHDAVKGITEVDMRRTTPKYYGSPSQRSIAFKADKKSPVHISTQNPGDRVMFVLYGGITSDWEINPSEHTFKRARITQGTRNIRLTDFIVLPSRNPIL